ncbi:hypothetical protein [Dyadobacter sp. 3J3]|uniref:hypothetical protein n=1 Tax=Dyadobacter sp. 3J3 TaxID=2606600 RepID=UPI00135B4099|nr:hypothetical protein [Dyadobacter sp. 3J3]
MDLKKIKEKNPGFEFSVKATKKASESVLQNSIKSRLNINAYNQKYAGTFTSSKDSEDENQTKSDLVDDSKWRFIKKISTNNNTDFPEEPKSSLFNEHGDEVAAED